MPMLLVDFGSTFTKVCAVDLEVPKILGTAQAFTTVEDVQKGLQAAVALLEEGIGPQNYGQTLACSSAAGGLSMVAIGLVPSLTAKAARLACYGAGAKILKSFAYELTEADVLEIKELNPDIVLLTGGIDGGNSKTILHNARMLASIERAIIVAGNRSARTQIQEILAGREFYLCENVMPAFNELNLEPVKTKIRELFLEKITLAKGLDPALVLMPTPAAVLKATELLASAWGDLLAVDLGGATTDVYSHASGYPKADNILVKGLVEPYSKRTVEGDIGMRYGARGIAEAIGAQALSNLGAGFLAFYEKIKKDPAYLPTEAEADYDRQLARAAVKIAVDRHAGLLETVYTPLGQVFSQTGKDLREVEILVLTGGALIKGSWDVSAAASWDPEEPWRLKPQKMRTFVDRRYILAAMGLLATVDPAAALAIMEKELVLDGD